MRGLIEGYVRKSSPNAEGVDGAPWSMSLPCNCATPGKKQKIPREQLFELVDDYFSVDLYFIPAGIETGEKDPAPNAWYLFFGLFYVFGFWTTLGVEEATVHRNGRRREP